MEDKRTLAVWIAITALVLLPCAYVGTYFLVLEEGGVVSGVVPLMTMDVRPTYRVGGRSTEMFYWPIHSIDKRFRRSRWTTSFDLPPRPLPAP